MTKQTTKPTLKELFTNHKDYDIEKRIAHFKTTIPDFNTLGRFDPAIEKKYSGDKVHFPADDFGNTASFAHTIHILQTEHPEIGNADKRELYTFLSDPFTAIEYVLNTSKEPEVINQTYNAAITLGKWIFDKIPSQDASLLLSSKEYPNTSDVVFIGGAPLMLHYFSRNPISAELGVDIIQKSLENVSQKNGSLDIHPLIKTQIISILNNFGVQNNSSLDDLCKPEGFIADRKLSSSQQELFSKSVRDFVELARDSYEAGYSMRRYSAFIDEHPLFSESLKGHLLSAVRCGIAFKGSSVEPLLYNFAANTTFSSSSPFRSKSKTSIDPTSDILAFSIEEALYLRGFPKLPAFDEEGETSVNPSKNFYSHLISSPLDRFWGSVDARIHTRERLFDANSLFNIRGYGDDETFFPGAVKAYYAVLAGLVTYMPPVDHFDTFKERENEPSLNRLGDPHINGAQLRKNSFYIKSWFANYIADVAGIPEITARKIRGCLYEDLISQGKDVQAIALMGQFYDRVVMNDDSNYYYVSINHKGLNAAFMSHETPFDQNSWSPDIVSVPLQENTMYSAVVINRNHILENSRSLNLEDGLPYYMYSRKDEGAQLPRKECTAMSITKMPGSL